MTMLAVGDEKFRIRWDGPEGAPVLMLSNSLGTDHTMWDPQIPEFSKKFRVLRYDSRGHGQSPVSPGPYSIAGLGRDALAILDTLKIQRVNWCGLSKGGMVGQWILANAGHRLHKAVLANTSAKMGPPDTWNARIRLLNEKGMEPVAQSTPDRWFTKRFQSDSPAVVKAIADNMRTLDPAGYAACCAAIRDMDQRESNRTVTTPVLVIVGAHDPATPPAVGEEIASRIKGSRVVSLDAAHLSNVEQPQAFTRAVLEFLS